ncbi:HU family DNA-binding protein [Pseudomonas sp. RP23018S]|uniref:HU family DNA-binding protein n=1 Tax=Pseudomonas sp. RP23018S TaxID=3096037 RepID=UPI002ACAD3FB|nr:HU family DNA-binding protein [Pseudomonas sp. RP23018S]MDZ5605296.1 HU family DNA-binding protein [Pseudomonas sp. RP23018S]
MNKSELIASLAERADVSKGKATALLEAFQDIVGEELREKREVVLVGFGTFKVKESAARVGRNPSTGEQIQIGAKTTASFKPGKVLNEAVR